MLFKRALLSHSMKWQSAFSIEHTSIIISNQGQQLIHHNPDTRFETRIGDDFAEGGRGLAALNVRPAFYMLGLPELGRRDHSRCISRKTARQRVTVFGAGFVASTK